MLSQTERELRSWLARHEFDTLVRVIESAMKVEAVKALERATQANTFPDYALAADEHMKRASRFRTALDVLNEVRSRQEPFSVARMT